MGVKENIYNKEQEQRKTILIISILSLIAVYIIVRLIVGNIRKKRKIAKEKNKIDVDQIKTLFIQNMSHEIKAPLNAVINFNEMLNGKSGQGISADDRESLMKLLKSNTELLQSMVNDIMSMAQLENGTYKPVLADFNVQHICKLVMDSAKNLSRPGVEMLLD